ncbi:hypothetical protein JXB11_00250 [Candidatus Woesearchaeota archaeon]|nr:hypothetical protein [Candidatus Woesearchaeota archaeon]
MANTFPLKDVEGIIAEYDNSEYSGRGFGPVVQVLDPEGKPVMSNQKDDGLPDFIPALLPYLAVLGGTTTPLDVGQIRTKRDGSWHPYTRTVDMHWDLIQFKAAGILRDVESKDPWTDEERQHPETVKNPFKHFPGYVLTSRSALSDYKAVFN